MKLVAILRCADQDRVNFGEFGEFRFGIDVECCANCRSEVRDPEVWPSVIGLIGVLDDDKFEDRVRFRGFTTYEIPDEDQSSHPELGHFFGEALQLGFEHLPSLSAEAEHHWGHRSSAVR